MPAPHSSALASLGSRPPRSETEMGRVKNLASTRHHSRSPDFGALDPARRLHSHYEVLRSSRPGPLLDRLYVRLAAPVGIVAPPPRPAGSGGPDFARLPLASFDEAVREAAKSTAGIDALDAFARAAARPGDPLALVRRAVALRALGRLTREESVQAYAVYLRERHRVPELEKIVGWLL